MFMRWEGRSYMHVICQKLVKAFRLNVSLQFYPQIFCFKFDIMDSLSTMFSYSIHVSCIIMERLKKLLFTHSKITKII